MVRQVTPTSQRRLFDAVLDLIEDGRDFVNEVIEIEIADEDFVSITRYELPGPDAS